MPNQNGILEGLFFVSIANPKAGLPMVKRDGTIGTEPATTLQRVKPSAEIADQIILVIVKRTDEDSVAIMNSIDSFNETKNSKSGETDGMVFLRQAYDKADDDFVNALRRK